MKWLWCFLVVTMITLVGCGQAEEPPQEEPVAEEPAGPAEPDSSGP